jgi:hypothetical protein
LDHHNHARAPYMTRDDLSIRDFANTLQAI